MPLPTKYSEAWLDQMTRCVEKLKDVTNELLRAKDFGPDWNWDWTTPPMSGRQATVRMSTKKLIRILTEDVTEAQKAIDELTSLPDPPKPGYRGDTRGLPTAGVMEAEQAQDS